jgi:hypothetical protein
VKIEITLEDIDLVSRLVELPRIGRDRETGLALTDDKKGYVGTPRTRGRYLMIVGILSSSLTPKEVLEGYRILLRTDKG